MKRGVDWRRPRERSWLLFVTAVVLAVLAVVVARWRGPSWALAAVAAAAAVAGVIQGRLQERAKAEDRQQQLLAQFAITEGGRGERLPLVGEADDPALRVHRAQVSADGLADALVAVIEAAPSAHRSLRHADRKSRRMTRTDPGKRSFRNL